jgi:hypothetical protein
MIVGDQQMMGLSFAQRDDLRRSCAEDAHVNTASGLMLLPIAVCGPLRSAPVLSRFEV